MNFALILVVLTAVTGIVVLVDNLSKRNRDESPDIAGQSVIETGSKPGIIVEYSRSFFPVLLFVLVIRSFIFEPFRIPSGSMMPTLLQGDYIFVKKFAYGLRLPVLETKIFETGEPERGDVVVFRLPTEPNVNYIKRVVGLPGDVIEYDGHRLTINGEQVALNRDAATPEHGGMAQFTELLGEREHAILIANPSYTMRDGVYEVPEGAYFMMGDNRDNSRDSRFIGAIPESFLVGEAVRIWLHMDGIEVPRWERIGTKIQ
ncbi:MAG: signal peptidase I [Pseudomonadota bacterium]